MSNGTFNSCNECGHALMPGQHICWNCVRNKNARIEQEKKLEEQKQKEAKRKAAEIEKNKKKKSEVDSWEEAKSTVGSITFFAILIFYLYTLGIDDIENWIIGAVSAFVGATIAYYILKPAVQLGVLLLIIYIINHFLNFI